jgi:hypothetical protein
MGNRSTCGLFGIGRTEDKYYIYDLSEEENQTIKDIYHNMEIQSKNCGEDLYRERAHAL